MDRIVLDLLDTYTVTDATRLFLNQQPAMYIDGKFIASSSNQTLDVIEPSTGGVLTQISRGNESDVELAIASSKRAFEGEWSRMKPRKREQIMRKIAELIRKNLQTIAELETLDSGKAITGCKAVDISGAANV